MGQQYEREARKNEALRNELLRQQQYEREARRDEALRNESLRRQQYGREARRNEELKNELLRRQQRGLRNKHMIFRDELENTHGTKSNNATKILTNEYNDSWDVGSSSSEMRENDIKVEDVSDDEDDFAYSKSLLPSPGNWMEPNVLYQ